MKKHPKITVTVHGQDIKKAREAIAEWAENVSGVTPLPDYPNVRLFVRGEGTLNIKSPALHDLLTHAGIK